MSTFAQNVPRLCWDSRLKKHVTCPPTIGQVASGQQPGTDPPPRRVCCLEDTCCLNCNDLLSIFNCLKSTYESVIVSNLPVNAQTLRVQFIQGFQNCGSWEFQGLIAPFDILDKNTNEVVDCYKVELTNSLQTIPLGGSITQCLTFIPQTPDCQRVGYCFDTEVVVLGPSLIKYKLTNIRFCTDPDAVVDTATLSACVSCVSIAAPTPPAPDTCCISDTCCMDCDELWAIFECFKAKVEGYSVPGVPPNATTVPVYGAPGGNILQDVNTPPCPPYSFHEDGEIRKNGLNFSADATCLFVYDVSNRIAVPIPPGGSVTQCFTIQSIGNTCGSFFSTPVGICFETIAVYEEIGGLDTWRNQITNARLCATPLIVVASEDINDCVDCETGDVDCPGITGILEAVGGTSFIKNVPFSINISIKPNAPACCGDLYLLFLSAQPGVGNTGTLSIVGSPFNPIADMSGLVFTGTAAGDTFVLFFDIISDNCEVVTGSLFISIF